jgi:hypothetical protein
MRSAKPRHPTPRGPDPKIKAKHSLKLKEEDPVSRHRSLGRSEIGTEFIVEEREVFMTWMSSMIKPGSI